MITPYPTFDAHIKSNNTTNFNRILNILKNMFKLSHKVGVVSPPTSSILSSYKSFVFIECKKGKKNEGDIFSIGDVYNFVKIYIEPLWFYMNQMDWLTTLETLVPYLDEWILLWLCWIYDGGFWVLTLCRLYHGWACHGCDVKFMLNLSMDLLYGAG